jgi:hypothetical protein
MKIYAPVKDFNGLRNNVRFVNGVGETDNMLLVSWFQSHGYHIEDESHIATVEMSEKIPNISDEKCENEDEIPSEKCAEPDFDAMTPLELREWARANGFGSKIKNTRNKEKLLEIIRG